MESGMIWETYNLFFTGKEYPRFTVIEFPFLTGKECNTSPYLYFLHLKCLLISQIIPLSVRNNDISELRLDPKDYLTSKQS